MTTPTAFRGACHWRQDSVCSQTQCNVRVCYRTLCLRRVPTGGGVARAGQVYGTAAHTGQKFCLRTYTVLLSVDVFLVCTQYKSPRCWRVPKGVSVSQDYTDPFAHTLR